MTHDDSKPLLNPHTELLRMLDNEWRRSRPEKGPTLNSLAESPTSAVVEAMDVASSGRKPRDRRYAVPKRHPNLVYLDSVRAQEKWQDSYLQLTTLVSIIGMWLKMSATEIEELWDIETDHPFVSQGNIKPSLPLDEDVARLATRLQERLNESQFSVPSSMMLTTMDGKVPCISAQQGIKLAYEYANACLVDYLAKASLVSIALPIPHEPLPQTEEEPISPIIVPIQLSRREQIAAAKEAHEARVEWAGAQRKFLTHFSLICDELELTRAERMNLWSDATGMHGRNKMHEMVKPDAFDKLLSAVEIARKLKGKGQHSMVINNEGAFDASLEKFQETYMAMLTSYTSWQAALDSQGKYSAHRR
jgi:hypothetical protein